MVKKIICSECCKEVKKCEMCGEIFEVGNPIICLKGEHHFCSKECFLQFFILNSYVIETYIGVEDG